MSSSRAAKNSAAASDWAARRKEAIERLRKEADPSPSSYIVKVTVSLWSKERIEMLRQ
jgi:hypothetical protein